jgi:hypothetical protein
VSLGILGAYIGRIYEETKLRPKFIVDEAYVFSNIQYVTERDFAKND